MHKYVTFGFKKRQKELVGSIIFAYLQLVFNSVLNFNLLPFLSEAITLKDETGWNPVRQFNLKFVNILAFGMNSILKSCNFLRPVADY